MVLSSSAYYMYVCVFLYACVGKLLTLAEDLFALDYRITSTTLPGDFLILKLRGVTLKKREALISK